MVIHGAILARIKYSVKPPPVPSQKGKYNRNYKLIVVEGMKERSAVLFATPPFNPVFGKE
jgi:hypothetical protein